MIGRCNNKWYNTSVQGAVKLAQNKKEASAHYYSLAATHDDKAHET